jgi:DNA end-binding protein Ku
MAHALWKGSISFGLVNVPVQLETAVREKSVSFHMLSKDGHCRLRRKLYCPDTGEEFEFSDTTRGIEVEPGHYVVVQPEEIDKLRPAKDRTIDIQQFVKLKEIDPIYFDRVYFVVPAQGSAKPYRLLHQAMLESEKIALARFILHQKQQLGALRVMGDGLVLHTMHYPDEVLAMDDSLPGTLAQAKADSKQVAIAKQLIDSMTHKLDLTQFHDEYRERLEMLVQQKKGQRKTVPVSDDHDDKAAMPTINLMEALKKSLREGGRSSSRGRTTRSSHAHPRSRAA